jgi:hypothetical protein
MKSKSRVNNIVRPVLSASDYQKACLGAALRGVTPREYIAQAIHSLLEIDRQTLISHDHVLCGSELRN